MSSHVGGSTEKVGVPPNHDEYANNGVIMDEKAPSPSDTDDMGIGMVTTPPNFDNIDEKKVLWKVRRCFFSRVVSS